MTTHLHLTRRESLVWVSVALSTGAHAQTYPSKTITMVVPFPAGGGTDAVARLIAEKMSKKLSPL
jgi:tripartite-type tricarboxylate transporter receptor subunit TctC